MVTYFNVGLVLLLTRFTFAEIKNKGWWKHAVFYQVYPRSFMDANSDGIGDIQGITRKLEHFVDAGIGGIWLSPIYASPMIDFGYDISDFKDIDPGFGTMADFEKLVARAKQLGIKVIMDLVPNHTSDKHYWFQQSARKIGKYTDYYVWHEGKNGGPPNNWVSVFQGSAWSHLRDDQIDGPGSLRSQYYFHQFEYRQPDLNFDNPNVLEEMEGVIKFWLDKGVDGFRIDAIPHVYEDLQLRDEPLNPNRGPDSTYLDYGYHDHIYTKHDIRSYELIRSWRRLLDEYADIRNVSEKIIMTEAYGNFENITRYYNYGSNIPFNFGFIEDIDRAASPEKFKEYINLWANQLPNGALPNWVMGNHDKSRLATRYPGRANQMIMLEMVLPGIAVTYYGEEIGMEDKLDISWEDTQDPQACNAGKETYQQHSRDPQRTPMQWDSSKNAGFSKANKTWIPVHENYVTLNLANQKQTNQSHYKLYQELIKLRKSSSTLKDGSCLAKVFNNNKVLAVFRGTSKESVILLMNFSEDQSVSVDISAHTLGENKAKLLLANVESGIQWNSEVSVADVQLQKNGAVILVAKPD